MACPLRLGAKFALRLLPPRAIRSSLSVVVFSAVLFCAPHLDAQESVFVLDPSKSSVGFALGASLHTVYGTFKLKSSEFILIRPKAPQMERSLLTR
jgi:hypothetical protein